MRPQGKPRWEPTEEPKGGDVLLPVLCKAAPVLHRPPFEQLLLPSEVNWRQEEDKGPGPGHATQVSTHVPQSPPLCSLILKSWSGSLLPSPLKRQDSCKSPIDSPQVRF